MTNFYLSCRPLDGKKGHEAGRNLLSEMYLSVTGSPSPAIEILPGGKPCFSVGPWYFSITHTKRRVFVALSMIPIGIDAEEADRRISPGLAEKILSPGEYSDYRQAADKNAALLKFWVLKEAQVKFTGEGLRGYPNHTNFRLDDTRVRMKNGCYLAVITGPEEIPYAF